MIIALALLGSCRDGFGPPPGPNSQATLLSCPSSQTQAASLPIGTAGGTLSLGGTSVTIPLGALTGDNTVELTIPAGPYMEVDLTVNGGHFEFLKPVVVTIDYSRCDRSQTLLRALSVWNIDPATKALLDNMGGVDSKLTQSITFTTPHFSGFAVAY
jgi:hypothetical protein